MVTYTNNQAPAPTPSDNSGTNAGLIILAFIIVAAIVVAAIYFMNSPAQTNTNTTTSVDRTVSRIEQVPAQTGQAIDNAVSNPDNAANPPANTAPATNPQPAPAPTDTTTQPQ